MFINIFKLEKGGLRRPQTESFLSQMSKGNKLLEMFYWQKYLEVFYIIERQVTVIKYIPQKFIQKRHP